MLVEGRHIMGQRRNYYISTITYVYYTLFLMQSLIQSKPTMLDVIQLLHTSCCGLTMWMESKQHCRSSSTILVLFSRCHFPFGGY
jgi:hypothetical protein